MKIKKLCSILSILSILLISGNSLSNQANAATTYSLNLTLVNKASAASMALYESDQPLTSAYALQKCGSPSMIWLFNSSGGFGNSSESTNSAKNYFGKDTKIRIKNDAGKIVGIGTLTKVGWKTDHEEIDSEDGTRVWVGNCTYSTTIKIASSNFYSIEFSGKGSNVAAYDVSLSELKKQKWKITLSIQ